VPTLSELIEQKTQEFQAIYGENINVAQNTPDGQFINIEAQAEADLGEFLVGIYNSFDPDSALGRELDRVVAYKGLKRQGASYTRLNISLVADRATLVKAGFLVGDANGNNFSLEEDLNIIEAGTVEAIFRAVKAGAVTVALQTVNNIVTPTLGITAALNNYPPVEVGLDEESDFNLRTRFNTSVALDGSGHISNLYSRILNLAGVTSCYIDENRGGETNGYGTPGHSIWVIVNGGDDQDIASTIYGTLSDGCGMRGEIEVVIYDSLGNPQEIYFDRVTLEDLFIRFSVYGKDPQVLIDPEQIRKDLVDSIRLEVNMTVDKNYINVLLAETNSNIIYSDIKVSKDGSSWFDMIKNTSLNYQFQLSKENIQITVT
jgi:uncharacterized phage protein gp47/JayE